MEDELAQRGLETIRLVPEDTDVPLKERVNRANTLYKCNGRQNP